MGNSDERRIPALTRGFAVRLAADGSTLDVFVGRAQSPALLANLRPGGAMAVTVANPTDRRAVQVKGRIISWQEAEATDQAWLERYWTLFQALLDRVGIPPVQSQRLRCRDLVRVTFAPTALFRQTPGPAAGSALEQGTPWS